MQSRQVLMMRGEPQTPMRMLVIPNNRLYAMTVLGLTGVLLVYYTLWVIGLPFVAPVYLHYVSW